MNGQQGGKTELVCGILDAKKVFQGRKQFTMSNTLFMEVEKQSSNYKSQEMATQTTKWLLS